MGYGFSEIEAKIICAKVAIGDTDWEIKKPEEEVSTFETEVTPEEREIKVKKRKPKTTAAGGKAVKKEKGKERSIHTAPKAMQMPLFQPWRAFKSEHRLQTKLEKIVTAEEKFLTMEQLLKRAEYALAIKKKDAEPFIVYAIPEEVWDQAVGMGKGGQTTKEGYPIVGWMKKGGASIPLVGTPAGPKSVDEAKKMGVKPGGGAQGGSQVSLTEKLGERGKRRIEAKGQIPFSEPRTKAEAAEHKGRERDRLNIGLEKLEKRTLEIKTPLQRYREYTGKQIREVETELPSLSTKEKAIRIEINKIENSPSFKTIGANVQVQINFDELPEQDLWAHIVNDLNWTTEGINDEYKRIATMMGKSPFVYQEVRNVLAQKESLARIKNADVLHDFIVHTKNHYLKKAAMERLKTVNKDYYKVAITNRISGPQSTAKSKTRYGINPRKYNTEKKDYDEAKIQKEKYLSQSYNKYFEKDVPEKEMGRLLKEERTTDQEYKANDPDGGYQALKEMGLAEGGKIKTTVRLTKEERISEAVGEQEKKSKIQTFKIK